MIGAFFGWLLGSLLAVAIILVFGVTGFVVPFFLGFGLSYTGGILGLLASGDEL